MRLHQLFKPLLEAAAPLQGIMASRAFRKELADSTAEVQRLCLEFIHFKVENPTTLYNSKDAPFAKYAGNYMHVHLKHGKNILLYRIADGILYLHRLVTHAEFDLSRGAKMADRMAVEPMAPFTMPTEQVPTLGEDVKQDLEHMIYELAANPVDVQNVLEPLKTGNVEKFAEFAILTCRLHDQFAHLDDQAIMAAVMRVFGGPEKLVAYVETVVSYLHPPAPRR